MDEDRAAETFEAEVLHDAEDLCRMGQGTSLHNFGELRVTVDVLGGSEGDGCVVGEGTSDSRNVLVTKESGVLLGIDSESLEMLLGKLEGMGEASSIADSTNSSPEELEEGLEGLVPGRLMIFIEESPKGGPLVVRLAKTKEGVESELRTIHGLPLEIDVPNDNVGHCGRTLPVGVGV